MKIVGVLYDVFSLLEFYFIILQSIEDIYAWWVLYEEKFKPVVFKFFLMY